MFLWPGCFCAKDKHTASLKPWRSLCDPKQKVTFSWASSNSSLFWYLSKLDGLFRISHLPRPRPIKAWVCFLVYQECHLRNIYWSAAVMLPTGEVAEIICELGRSQVTTRTLHGWRLSGSTQCSGWCRHQTASWWELPRKVGALP